MIMSFGSCLVLLGSFWVQIVAVRLLLRRCQHVASDHNDMVFENGESVSIVSAFVSQRDGVSNQGLLLPHLYICRVAMPLPR
jgi:hypothetical protein